MDGSGLSRLKFIGETFAAKLLVHIHPVNWIVRCRTRRGFNVRKNEFLHGCCNLEVFPFIVEPYRPNLHSRPSDSSFLMRSRTRFPAESSHLIFKLPSKVTLVNFISAGVLIGLGSFH